MKRNTPDNSLEPILPGDLWPKIISFLTIKKTLTQEGSFEYAFVIQFVSKAMYDIVSDHRVEHLAYRKDFSSAVEPLITSSPEKRVDDYIKDPHVHLCRLICNHHVNLVWWLRDIDALASWLARDKWMDKCEELWRNAGELGDLSVLNWLITKCATRVDAIMHGAVLNNQTHIIDWVLRVFGKVMENWAFCKLEHWLVVACKKGYVGVLERLVGCVTMEKSTHHCQHRRHDCWVVLTILPNSIAYKESFSPINCLKSAIRKNHTNVLEFWAKHGVTIQRFAEKHDMEYIRELIKFWDGTLLTEATKTWLRTSGGVTLEECESGSDE